MGEPGDAGKREPPAEAGGPAVPPSAPEASDTGYSGRLLVRMPKTLHADLAARSQADGTSLNQFIVGVLSRAVGDGQRQPPPVAPVRATPQMPRALRISLLANAVVVVLMVGLAAALLVVALR